MIARQMLQWMVLLSVFTAVNGLGALPDTAPRFSAELIFPLHHQHNHAPALVECPNGDLLVSWYRGSGERRADDVAVYGARRPRKRSQWSEPFLMVDTPGFPDGNTAMFIDRRRRLWLFWPIVLANTWESCLTSYRVAGIKILHKAGCGTVFLNGSFVSDKPQPGDFDACWDTKGVDPNKLDPV